MNHFNTQRRELHSHAFGKHGNARLGDRVHCLPGSWSSLGDRTNVHDAASGGYKHGQESLCYSQLANQVDLEQLSDPIQIRIGQGSLISYVRWWLFSCEREGMFDPRERDKPVIALLTMKSSFPPVKRRTFAAAWRIDSASETSSWISSRPSCWRWPILATFLAEGNTLSPRLWNSCASASPIPPWLQPVIRTVRRESAISSGVGM